MTMLTREQLKTTNAICHIDGDDITSGTGFFVRLEDKLYLVTDYHVLINRDNNDWYKRDFVLHFRNQESEVYYAPLVRLSIDESKVIYKSDQLDLCVIEILDDNVSIENGKLDFNSIDCFALNEIQLADTWGNSVCFFGFPLSLKIEAPFDMKPLLVRGTMCSYDIREDRFITDIPVYYGNSGSPAFTYTREGNVVLLGIVQQLVQFNLTWFNPYEHDIKRTDWHNSGYSICRCVNSILQLIKQGHVAK